jgi:oxygen-independent coproporphyrinogen-3 oxidase
MNRSHNSKQSIESIEMAASVGFENITIDLIYGIPGLGIDQWRHTVSQALSLPINHLSAYGLTLEPNTPYDRLVNQKKYNKPEEESMSQHFEALLEIIDSSSWRQYEVSNFCKNENYSKHNTAYWQNKKYLGLGPSAHSFDGTMRMWNVSSNSEYVEKLTQNKVAYDTEIITENDRLNETLLTGLRTIWGVDLSVISHEYDYSIQDLYREHLAKWHESGWIHLDNSILTLTSTGFLFADYIASELFKVD